MNDDRGEIGLRSQDRVGSTPTAPHPTLREMIRQYYELPGNGAGGSLHVVLDDGNIDSQSIQYCRAIAADRGDWRALIIADLLLARSQRGRAKVVGR